MTRTAHALIVVTGTLAVATAPAAADAQKHKADSSLTSSVLNGGDRELTVLRFAGSSTVMTGDDFLRFGDGSLTNNAGTFGWTTPIVRDLTATGALYSGNPDRADTATPYALEASGAATLGQVFGPFGSGYKNMSYLLDGEDNGSWTLDLYFDGVLFSADNDNDTLELALIERGMDSNIRVSGIRSDHSITPSVNVARGNFGSVGWSLNTLETSSAQSVGAVGISLDSDWTNLVGFRFEALSQGMNGPDLIGVGVAGGTMDIASIPAPGSVAVLAPGALLASRRRRPATRSRTSNSV